MTQILLNGSPHDVDEGCTVDRLVRELTGRDSAPASDGECAAPGVAVAVDETVVPRDHWAEHALVDGARVEVLTAVQGG